MGGIRTEDLRDKTVEQESQAMFHDFSQKLCFPNIICQNEIVHMGSILTVDLREETCEQESQAVFHDLSQIICFPNIICQNVIVHVGVIRTMDLREKRASKKLKQCFMIRIKSYICEALVLWT